MQRTRPFRRLLGATAPVALALGLLATGPAAAQALCAPRERLTAGLEQRFTEQQAAMALTDDGRVVELFTAPDGVTWTLLATTPEGLSCMIASGRFWTPRAGEEGLVAAWPH
ncbi:hypothetical protein SH611_12575 [Geminicoccaceae bacterium 1502E]|nr:hypothetical protein [Geminicoccaceae bacterium 1502E]